MSEGFTTATGVGALGGPTAAALGRISPRLLSRTSPSWLHDSAQDLADPQKRVRRKARPRVTQQ